VSNDGEHRAEHRGLALEAPRRGPGQPKYVVPEGDVNKVIRAIRQGKSEVSIARALQINYRTWTRVRAEDERIASALAETRRFEEEELVSLLMDKARAGDTTSIIFALKGRHGYRDQGAPQGGTEQRVNVTINLPGAQASLDDYMRTVEGTHT
jgi:leucyl aminopeptidase (aminopeptidase T)